MSPRNTAKMKPVLIMSFLFWCFDVLLTWRDSFCQSLLFLKQGTSFSGNLTLLRLTTPTASLRRLRYSP